MQPKWQMHILLSIRSRTDASCLCLLHYGSSFGTLPNSHFHSEHLPCLHTGEKQPIRRDAMSDCQMTFGNIEKRKKWRVTNEVQRCVDGGKRLRGCFYINRFGLRLHKAVAFTQYTRTKTALYCKHFAGWMLVNYAALPGLCKCPKKMLFGKVGVKVPRLNPAPHPATRVAVGWSIVAQSENKHNITQHLQTSGFPFLLIFFWIGQQGYWGNQHHKKMLANFYWLPFNLNIVSFPTVGSIKVFFFLTYLDVSFRLYVLY